MTAKSPVSTIVASVFLVQAQVYLEYLRYLLISAASILRTNVFWSAVRLQTPTRV